MLYILTVKECLTLCCDGVGQIFTSNFFSQKQPPEVSIKKAVLKYLAILTGKHLQLRFFLVNIAKFLRKTTLKNI